MRRDRADDGKLAMGESADRRMYVIQHHRQGRLEHWDLMFEVPGEELLRTFQIYLEPTPEIVRRGIPMRESAPHRRKYLVYEGEISGGRGSVKIWDSGGMVMLSATDKMLRFRLESARDRHHPEWVMHAQGGGDWKLTGAGEWPVEVNLLHLPSIPAPVDPLKRRVFREGL
jgi:hypothetical protein